MTSWSFRGALFEYEFPSESKDLPPVNDGIITGNNRQKSSDRTLLYNDFFNASDKAFADANPNWTLSADVTSSRIILGYYLGLFIPIGEYHRFIKVGLGMSVYYLDLLLKLNLCSQYKVTPIPDAEDYGTYKGECVGKTEIDSYSGNKFGISEAFYLTFWERRTKDSVWRIISTTQGWGFFDVKLKNHSKDLGMRIGSQTNEFISFTYLF
jgi:hypothetical protein